MQVPSDMSADQKTWCSPCYPFLRALVTGEAPVGGRSEEGWAHAPKPKVTTLSPYALGAKQQAL